MSRTNDRQPGMSSWILMGTLLSVLLPLLVTVALVNHYISEQARQSIRHSLSLQADSFTFDLNNLLAERLDDLQTALNGMRFPSLPKSIVTQMGMPPLPDGVSPSLVFTRQNNHSFQWLALINADGIVEQSSHQFLLGHQVALRPHRWQTGDRVILGPTRQQNVTGVSERLLEPPSSPQLYLFVPATTYGPGYWLMAAFDWQDAEQLATRILRSEHSPPGAELMMVDEKQHIVLSTGNKLPAGIPDVIREQPAAAQYAHPLSWPGELDAWFTQWRPIHARPATRVPAWQIVVRQPGRLALQDLTLLRDRMILGAMVTVFILILLSIWIAQRLARPLVRLSKAIEKPDPQVGIPLVDDFYEVSLLSRVMHDMVLRDEQQRLALEEMNRSLEQQVEIRTGELNNILEHATNAFISISAKGLVKQWNRRAELLFGWHLAEVLGKPLPAHLFPAPQQMDLRYCLDTLADGLPSVLPNARQEFMLVTRHGRFIPVQWFCWVSKAGSNQRLNLIIEDISDRHAHQQALQASQRRLQTITDNLPVLIGYIDRHLAFRFGNATYQQWYGWRPSEMEGKHIEDLFPPAECEVILPHIAGALAGELQRFERKHLDGERLQYFISTFVPDRTSDGEVQGLYLLTQDITSRKQLELELEQQARQDPLTSLPNRRAMLESLPQAMARANRQQKPMALMFMDLDGFKGVNDQWGHDAGDEVLRQFARRIQQQVRETDTLFRLAGDEFTLIVENLHQPAEEAQQIAHKICQTSAQPFELEEARALLSTSIGIAIYQPGQQRNADTLLMAADQAMYQAKHSGKNAVCLAPDMAPDADGPPSVEQAPA